MPTVSAQTWNILATVFIVGGLVRHMTARSMRIKSVKRCPFCKGANDTYTVRTASPYGLDEDTFSELRHEQGCPNYQ